MSKRGITRRTLAAAGALLVGAAAAQGQLPGGGTGLEVNTVECRNLSDGTAVRSTGTATEWDCVALGLAVETGDRVSVSFRGRVPSAENRRGLDGSSVAPLFVESEISDREDGLSYAADFDLDGDFDLVVEDGFRWLEFVSEDPQAFVEHDLVGPEPNALGVVALDVNADGRPDIAASFGVDSNLLQWYQNVPGDPPSFLSRPVYLEPGWTPWNLRAGDLDGDGDPDIVSWNNQNPGPLERLVWHENDGSGGFTPQVIYEVDTLPLSNAISFALGDLDGDGDLDIFAGVNDTELVWLENDGEVEPSWIRHFLDAEFTPPAIGIADFDRDGDLDVMAGSQKNAQLLDEIRFYENVDGTFSKPLAHTIAALEDGGGPRVGDLNGDGWPDAFLPFFSFPSSGLLWLENRGSLVFEPHLALNVDEHVPQVTAVAVDLEPDGDVDLVGMRDVAFDADDATVRVEAVTTVGGWTVGLTPDRVRCRNVTTGASVSDAAPAGISVDCEALGLAVSPGDVVLVTVRGVVE